MRAYSLIAPWPLAIARGGCRIINATDRIDYVGPVVFRCSKVKRFDRENAHVVQRACRTVGLDLSMVPSTHPENVLLFTGEMIGCFPVSRIMARATHDKKLLSILQWCVGPFCILLASKIEVFPQPIEWHEGGKFGAPFFNVPDDVVQKALAG